MGFARIINFDGCIHDGWLAMEDIDGRLDKVFLLQALNQMTEHFRAIAPAGTHPNLNTSIIKASMLEDAGWVEGKDWLNEVQLLGMNNKSGVGYADYVLYDDAHRPLAIIEAKKTCAGECFQSTPLVCQ